MSKVLIILSFLLHILNMNLLRYTDSAVSKITSIINTTELEIGLNIDIFTRFPSRRFLNFVSTS